MLNLMMLFASLLATWIVFSGYLEPFFLICGVISCLIAVYYAKKMDAVDHDIHRFYVNPKALFYFIWLFKEIIISSIDVSIRVWQAKPKVSPELGWVKSSQKTDLGKAAYANSITLTPGTVCIEVEGDDMCVHSLVEGGISGLEDSDMDAKVTKVTG